MMLPMLKFPHCWYLSFSGDSLVTTAFLSVSAGTCGSAGYRIFTAHCDIYKLRLNTCNTIYSQNVTCVCKNILSVKHILLECPITTELFQKNGYVFNTCDNIRDILYNTDIINSIVKLIVHSPVGKLV